MAAVAAGVAAAVEAVRPSLVVAVVAQHVHRYLPQATPITQCTTTTVSPTMVQAPVTLAMRRMSSASKISSKMLAQQPQSQS